MTNKILNIREIKILLAWTLLHTIALIVTTLGIGQLVDVREDLGVKKVYRSIGGEYFIYDSITYKTKLISLFNGYSKNESIKIFYPFAAFFVLRTDVIQSQILAEKRMVQLNNEAANHLKSALNGYTNIYLSEYERETHQSGNKKLVEIQRRFYGIFSGYNSDEFIVYGLLIPLLVVCILFIKRYKN